MGFKALTVNTPAEEPAHILAEDDAALYEGLFGADRVLNIGNKLKASVITNNKVRISDGVAVVGGHVGRIVKGDYEDLTIENGVSGQKRNDLIVARFQHGGTDTYKLAVVKGASGSTGVDPNIVQGNLYAGEPQRDYPLWRVRLDGLSIVKVEQMYEISRTNKDLTDTIDELNSKLNNMCDGGVASTTIPTQTHSIVSIKFNKTFKKVPAFTCNLLTSQVAADKIMIKKVTTTGAEVYAYSITTTHPAWVYWSAVSLDN